MGQDSGEKWATAVGLQPTIPKFDRLLGLLRVGLLPLLFLACMERGECVELIVNPRAPVSEISRAYARSIFGARVATWNDGSAIRVFVLSEDSPLHREMAKTLLDLYPYQLRAAWDRVVYTGLGQAPIEVASEEEMRRRVGSTPGAIGYIGKVMNHDSVRALPVR
jgi:hypothetical protein